MKKLLLVLAVCALAHAVCADVILQYSFTGSAPGVTASNVNVSGTDFAVSAGSLSYSTAGGSTTGGGLNPPAAFGASGWATTAIGKYFSFTLSLNAGYTLTLNSLDFQLGRTATGPQTWSVAYSTDAFVSTNFIGTGPFATLSGYTDTLWSNATASASLPVSGLTGVQFRIYGYNATSTGNFRIDEVTVNGTVIPEPATMAMLGLGTLALMLYRRWRR